MVTFSIFCFYLWSNDSRAFGGRVKRWRNKRLIDQLANLNRDLSDARTRAKRALEDGREFQLQAIDEKAQKEDLVKKLAEYKGQLQQMESLRIIRDAQAENIKDHVVITDIWPGRLKLAGDFLSVSLVFGIRNESLFDITIPPEEVKGALTFADRRLTEPIHMIVDIYRERIRNLRPLQQAKFMLEQPLRGFEAETIQKCLTDPDAKFSLSYLGVTITVGDGSTVAPRYLKVEPEFEHLPLARFSSTDVQA